MRSPADDCRVFCQASQIARVGAGWLLWIGRDDFEVTIFAEGEKRVARASSGMDSAERGADAGLLFDEGDAAIEIVAAE